MGTQPVTALFAKATKRVLRKTRLVDLIFSQKIGSNSRFRSLAALRRHVGPSQRAAEFIFFEVLVRPKGAAKSWISPHEVLDRTRTTHLRAFQPSAVHAKRKSQPRDAFVDASAAAAAAPTRIAVLPQTPPQAHQPAAITYALIGASAAAAARRYSALQKKR